MGKWVARLGKIPLKKGSRERVNKLLAYKDQHKDYVKNEADQKGYWWDCAFYQEDEKCDYLWFIAKSKNWGAIKTDEQITHTPYRAVYNKFKQDCWLQEKLTEKDYFVSIWENHDLKL